MEPPSHFARQPSLGHVPVALDGRGGNVKGNRGFLDREAAEKTQLDDPFLLRIAA
jgi:hypothetical protein